MTPTSCRTALVKRCLFLLALLVPGAGMAEAEDATALRLSCVDFPPYKIAPGEDPREGIDVEIIRAAFTGTAFKPQFDFMPFKRAIELAGRGDYDGICGCSYSLARASTFAFSNPVDDVSLGVFSCIKRRWPTSPRSRTSPGAMSSWSMVMCCRRI